MELYVMVKEKNGLYSIYNQGYRIKNAIFEGIEDFQGELDALGIGGDIVICNDTEDKLRLEN